jgi:hypothetical protein
MIDEPFDVPAAVLVAQSCSADVGFAMSCENRTGALLRTLAASKPGGRILELGTGTGVGAAWLLAGMDPTARLTTVEVDWATQAVAHGVLADDPRATFVLDDAHRWLAAYDGRRSIWRTSTAGRASSSTAPCSLGIWLLAACMSATTCFPNRRGLPTTSRAWTRSWPTSSPSPTWSSR